MTEPADARAIASELRSSVRLLAKFAGAVAILTKVADVFDRLATIGDRIARVEKCDADTRSYFEKRRGADAAGRA